MAKMNCEVKNCKNEARWRYFKFNGYKHICNKHYQELPVRKRLYVEKISGGAQPDEVER